MAETHSPPEDERNSPTAEPVTPEGEPATPKVEPGPGPGPDFHTLTTRATARLRRDRELRLEVAHELRTHLDAAAAEYRTAGYDDPAARAAAAHAFGDPDTLADDLWQAHRRRLRLRAWAWWTVRLTLLPVCLLALGGFVFSGLTYVTQYQNVEAFQDDDDNWIKRRVEARMTAEQRLIYFGDQSADNPVARWEAVRDRYPDEPLYQLQLLRTLLTYHDYPDGVESQEPWQQRISVDRILNEAARGRQLDPDNGIYDLIDAAYLFPLSLPLEPDPALGFSYETPVETGDDNGRATFEPYVFVEPVDEAAMDRLVRVVERAAAKPYISMHAVDLVRHRLAQLPPPRSLAEYMVRVASEVGTLLPHLGHHRAIARLLCAEAVRQAQLGAAGDEAAAQQAYHILETLSLANRNIAASDTLLIELLVSWSIETLVRNTRVVVAQILGDPAALQQAREAAQQLRQLYDRVWREPMARGVTEDRVARGGFLMSTVLPAIPGYDVGGRSVSQRGVHIDGPRGADPGAVGVDRGVAAAVADPVESPRLAGVAAAEGSCRCICRPSPERICSETTWWWGGAAVDGLEASAGGADRGGGVADGGVCRLDDAAVERAGVWVEPHVVAAAGVSAAGGDGGGAADDLW